MHRRLELTDLSPNVGLWWYFFTEMFDHFRPFFLAMFSVRHLTFGLHVEIMELTKPRFTWSSTWHQFASSFSRS
jgi:hypothetical protein